LLQGLGEGPIPAELVNGELPPWLKGLELFVCRVYCSTGPTTLPALRWELFRFKNLEEEMLAPLEVPNYTISHVQITSPCVINHTVRTAQLFLLLNKMAGVWKMDHNVSRIKGNSTMNKMTPVWRRSVKRFKSYRTFYVLASYHFMDGKMRDGKTKIQPYFMEIWS
jgi:hypothetical protein